VNPQESRYLLWGPSNRLACRTASRRDKEESGKDVLRKALQELGEGIGYGEGERGGKVPFTQSGK